MILNNNSEFIDVLIASAMSPLKSYVDIDLRAIKFTFHLRNARDYADLTRQVFDFSEKYFTDLIGEVRFSHTAVLSALDFDGTKITGACRDVSRAHVHGLVITPMGVNRCAFSSELSKHIQNSCGGFLRNRESVWIENFERSEDSDISDYIRYSIKDSIKDQNNTNVCIILPFDNMISSQNQNRNFLKNKHDRIMQILQSSDQFKIYRKSKKQGGISS